MNGYCTGFVLQNLCSIFKSRKGVFFLRLKTDTPKPNSI